MDELTPSAGACACPPALDELALIAAADDEADPDVTAHLRACSYCAERARAIADLQRQLRQRLYRMFCPTSDELAALQHGLLEATERERVVEHVAGCAQCQAELELLSTATGTPLLARPADASQRRVYAERVAPDPLLPGLTTGRPTDRRQSFRAGSLRLTLSVEQRLGLPRRASLSGRLTGSRHRAITASLLLNGRVVCSAPLAENGEFILEEVLSGEFALSLRLPDYEVVVEPVQIP